MDVAPPTWRSALLPAELLYGPPEPRLPQSTADWARSPKLSILMPVHNCEATVIRAVNELLKVDYPCPVELIIVDDGSTDGTYAELFKVVDDDRVIVYRHEHRQGKGAALLVAASLATGSYILPFDAGLEYSADDIPRLLKPVLAGRCQVVYGTRLFGYNTVYRSRRYARGNRVLTLLANVLFDACLTDLHTCLKLVPMSLFEELPLQEAGFGLDAEMTALLLKHGVRPFEIPVSYYSRSHAQGKMISWRDAVACVRTLFRVRLRRRATNSAGREAGVCLVGPGWTFTSGISYYTCRLANAVAESQQTSVIQLRRLLPRCLYPGRKRVGQPRASMTYREGIQVCNGIDWWWGRSLLRALKFLRARRPKTLVLEWWTAAALHTYLVLAVRARLLGMRVVIELHELQDPGEAGVLGARHYARWGLRTLLRLAHGCVVHSKSDWQLLESGYGSLNLDVAVASHGPYDQYLAGSHDGTPASQALISAVRTAPRPEVVNLLFFGLIRPYKGLEDLLRVFNGLSASEAAGLWLTVVGETWEGCTEPERLIRTSPHADRITFVNEYVPDDVVSATFEHADVVVLPYRRSSSSGILHIAMSHGLPVVVSRVGGLPEAADGYDGAVFIEPGDPDMLKSGIMTAFRMAGRRFTDPRDWGETVKAIDAAAGIAREQAI
jgi:glycosyltransferase involved in cell wall biosynthesis